jgi:hypothetical protein
MAYLKKTKRSKRKMRKTMRIRGGTLFGTSSDTVPGSATEAATQPVQAAPEPATQPVQAAPEPVTEAVTKEQAIECAKKVVMFLEQ